MSAARHLQDADRDGTALLTDLESVLTQCRRGVVVEAHQLEHLMAAARAVTYHVSLARVGLNCEERRDEPRVTVTPALPPTIKQLLTPAQQALDEYHDIGVEAASPLTLRRLP